MPDQRAGLVAARDSAIYARPVSFAHAEMSSQSHAGLPPTVHTGNVPQLDLIAMREGWTMTAEDSGTEGWSNVEFTRG